MNAGVVVALCDTKHPEQARKNKLGSTVILEAREVPVAPTLAPSLPHLPPPSYDYALCIGYIYPGVLLGFYFSNLFMLYVCFGTLYIFLFGSRGR